MFATPESTELINELFQYGKELGGAVHAVCSINVIQAINDFIEQEEITHIILGEVPKQSISNFSHENVAQKIKKADVKIYELERNEDGESKFKNIN